MKKTTRLLAAAMAALMLICSLSISAFAAAKPLNYLLLGDSIAFGAGVKNPESACFGKIVADTNGYSYKNLARNGSTTKDLITRLTADDAIAAVEEADIISLSIGGNNFIFSNVPVLLFKALFGDFSEVDKVVDEFYADFCDIISTIRTLNPDVLIILQTINNPVNGALRPVFQKALDTMNDKYKEYAAENGENIVVADVAAAINGNPDLAAFDLIHPSVQGNIVIARLLLGILNSKGLGEATEPVITVPGEETGTKLIRLIVVGISKALQ